ncbi:hypothetical protein BJX99DRAFT_237903 [Aspergillus californicus]
MGASQQLPAGFAFVQVDGLGKPNRSDRKIIRSHCMRDKNKKTGVDRWLASTLIVHSDEQERYDEVRRMSPRSLSDLSLLRFAFEVNNESKALVFDFMRFYKQTMNPIEIFINSNLSHGWIEWLFQDPAYLQCTFFMASGTRDLMQRQSLTPATFFHLRETIVRLNRQLSGAAAVGDSTITVVTILAMFCCMSNDHAGASAHLAGLQEMVRMRGGLEGLLGNVSLYMKLGRLDLLHALNTGSPGLLCSYPVSYSPQYYNLGPAPSPEDAYDPCIFALDPLVLTTFREMQYYTGLINNVHTSKVRRSESEFHTAICSFQYRLLQLQGTLIDDWSECVCLALLAFLITTFQFPGTRAKYPYLANRLRMSCAVDTHGRPELRNLMRWILILGAMAVFDVGEAEEWMLEKWRIDVDDCTWEEAKAQLDRIMWIGALQDSCGEAEFHELNSYQRFSTLS